MADSVSPRIQGSPTIPHPLATVASVHTVGGSNTGVLHGLTSPKNDKTLLRNLSETSNVSLGTRMKALEGDHCYPKFNALITNIKSTGALPTVTLFEELDTFSGNKQDDSGEEEEEEIDVCSIEPSPKLPLDEVKVKTAMLECEKHINLVKLVSSKMEKRDLSKATPQQRALLLRVCEVLQTDRLARLSCAENVSEPIDRRIHSDIAARKIRQALADVFWEPEIVHWVNEVLLQSLDPILLPVYLDALQVLKSKCPVLLERMIHSSVPDDSSDALDFLLKRPWNPIIGLQGMDKQSKLTPQPCFVIVPHTPNAQSSRRMKVWQHQLGNIGKVHTVALPSHISELGHGTTPESCARYMLSNTCSRVQELYSQNPNRPIILVTWLCGVRIACKVAEVLDVSLIVSLGPTSRGVEKQWDISTDPLKSCKAPLLFVAGSKSAVCSIPYMESLRLNIPALNHLVIVNGGDEMLRLQSADLKKLKLTQSIVDRCIQHELYSFLVKAVPVELVVEGPKFPKKRKASASHVGQDLNSTQLTPAPLCVSPLPIPLEPETKKTSNVIRTSSGSAPTLGRPAQAAVMGALYRSGSQGQAKAGHKVIRNPAKPAPKGGKKQTVSTQKSKPKMSESFTPASQGITSLFSSTSAGKFSSSPSPGVSPSHLFHVTSGGLRPLPTTPPRNPFASVSTSQPSQIQLAPGTLKQLKQTPDV